MGFATFRVTHKHVRRATPNSSCLTGGFYQAPTHNQVVDSLKPLEIKWDTTCLDTKKADIYLYVPTAERSRVAVWEKVDFTTGSATIDLMPRWWNATASMNLQLGIVPTGQPPFINELPAGPVFTATYTQPESGMPPSADTTIRTSSVMDMEQIGAAQSSRSLSPGKTAAAVLIPLLFVILCIGVYIKRQRNKSQEKSKRFSVAVDKRMSTISTDWKSVTVAGANAAIRNSIAVSGNNRNSSFSFGGIRPVSNNYVVEDGDYNNNHAGLGVKQMSQMRTGVGLRNPTPNAGTAERVSRVSFAADTRQSRVSFANDPRPSGESRRTRAFHSAYIPPVPSLPPTNAASSTGSDDGSTEDGALSPRQTQGPLTLTPEDIRARIAVNGRGRSASNATESSAASSQKKDEIDEVMPALSMMRTGNDQGDEYLLSPPPTAITHTPTTRSPVSPIYPTSPPPMMSPTMGNMPMPASVMSPDEMLRAYAERKKTGNGAAISYPMPVANTAASDPVLSPGMRTLFSPTTGAVGAPIVAGYYPGARYTIGDDEDPYGGTA